MLTHRTSVTQSTFGDGDLVDARGREYKLDFETALHVRPEERCFVYKLPRGVPPPHMGPDPEELVWTVPGGDDAVATGTVAAQYARSRGARCRTGVVVVSWKWLGWLLTEEETLRPNAVARPV